MMSGRFVFASIVGILVIVLLGYWSCHRNKADQKKREALEQAHCPVHVKPGHSIGPIEMGTSFDALKSQGVKINSYAADEVVRLVDTDLYKITFCKDKVIQVSLRDFAETPDCLYVKSKKVPLSSPFSDIEESFRLGQCEVQNLKTGDKYYYCDKGGLVIGVGLKKGKKVSQQWKHLGVIKPGLKMDTLVENCQ